MASPPVIAVSSSLSNEERWFLEVLHDNGWPPQMRLIWADWLEEHGREEEGREQRELVLRMLAHWRRYRRGRDEDEDAVWLIFLNGVRPSRLPPPLPRRAVG